jgi:hypothetical protein
MFIFVYFKCVSYMLMLYYSFLKTHWLLNANAHMSDEQRQRIQATPFKYLLELPREMKVFAPLWLEMLTRWDEEIYGFKVGSSVVPFTPLHVCFALGLIIVGEPVKHDDGEPAKHSHTRRLL